MKTKKRIREDKTNNRHRRQLENKRRRGEENEKGRHDKRWKGEGRNDGTGQIR